MGFSAQSPQQLSRYLKMNALVFLSLVAVAAASGSHQYHGRYAGKCANDGFYYNNHASFVICSNGNAYHQPCAPGSRNSGYNKYTYGNSYGYSDFCDVNLVDYGYGATHGHYGGHSAGYNGHNAGYGHSQGHSHGYGGGYGGYGGGYGARPESYHNRDGHATRHAYNDHGYGYGHHNAGYGSPHGGRAAHKTVSTKVSYSHGGAH